MTIFKRSGPVLAISALITGWALAAARGDDALTARFDLLDEQGERLLSLFRGARVPHPAAALAAWKRATRGRETLGKPLEAAIASMNPAMLRELKALDGAELRVDLAGDGGRTAWRLFAPKDDGSLAALGPALALTDGAVEAPIGDVTVLRLGPPGSPLAASRPKFFALASTRDGLRLALDGRPEPSGKSRPESGVHVRLEPSALRGLPTLSGRRFAEALAAVDCKEVRASLRLEDETLTLRVRSAFRAPPRGKMTTGGIEPAWLDVIPGSRTFAAVSVALDNRPESVDRAFAVLDRIERVDPARAGLAPLRTRLNVLAAVAGVKPEADLWPKLKGFTAAALVDDAGEFSGAVVALHADDTESAGRIAAEVLPRFTSALARGGVPVGDADEGRVLGMIGAHRVSVKAKGRHVLIGWGDGSLSLSLAALGAIERSEGAALRSSLGGPSPNRAGWYWPGRPPGFAPPGSAWGAAWKVGPPIAWEGRFEGDAATDVVRWLGLRGLIRRWLDALPLDP